MYNEMKNKETWTMNLYMQNQEGYYGYYKVLSTIVNKKALAELLRADWYSLIPEEIPRVLRKLLVNALEDIDWDAVANSFYE